MIERHGRIIACKCVEREAGDPVRLISFRTIEGDVHEFAVGGDEYAVARRALANRTPLVILLSEER